MAPSANKRRRDLLAFALCRTTPTPPHVEACSRLLPFYPRRKRGAAAATTYTSVGANLWYKRGERAASESDRFYCAPSSSSSLNTIALVERKPGHAASDRRDRYLNAAGMPIPVAVAAAGWRRPPIAIWPPHLAKSPAPSYVKSRIYCIFSFDPKTALTSQRGCGRGWLSKQLAFKKPARELAPRGCPCTRALLTKTPLHAMWSRPRRRSR